MFNKKNDPIKHAAQVVAQCKAKDPAACPYHSKYKKLDEAAKSNNVALFLQIKANIEATEKHNASEKLSRDRADALRAGDAKTYQALQNSKKKLTPAPVEQVGYREARSYGGFATHIVNLADCSDKALCGTEWLDLRSNVAPEQVEANLEKEHESFFYCRDCYQNFTGKAKPVRS